MGLSCFRAISGMGWVGLGLGLGSLCGAIVWASLCDANKAEHIVPFWASERTRQNKIYEMRAEKHSINYWSHIKRYTIFFLVNDVSIYSWIKFLFS